MTQDRYAEKAREICPNTACQYECGDRKCCDAIAQALREVAADAIEEAAKEALKPRQMFLTKQQIADGILDDNHPTLKIRAQMRREIADALEAKSQAIREQGEKP